MAQVEQSSISLAEAGRVEQGQRKAPSRGFLERLKQRFGYPALATLAVASTILSATAIAHIDQKEGLFAQLQAKVTGQAVALTASEIDRFAQTNRDLLNRLVLSSPDYQVPMTPEKARMLGTSKVYDIGKFTQFVQEEFSPKFEKFLSWHDKDASNLPPAQQALYREWLALYHTSQGTAHEGITLAKNNKGETIAIVSHFDSPIKEVQGFDKFFNTGITEGIEQQKKALMATLTESGADRFLGETAESLNRKAQMLDKDYLDFVATAWHIANGERASNELPNVFTLTLLDRIDFGKIRNAQNPWEAFSQELKNKNIQKEFVSGTLMMEMADLLKGRSPRDAQDWPVIRFVIKTLPYYVQQNKLLDADIGATKASELSSRMFASMNGIDPTGRSEGKIISLTHLAQYLGQADSIYREYAPNYFGATETIQKDIQRDRSFSR